MTILAIDTSAAVCGALVSADGTELASVVINEHRRHAEQLAPLIADLLAGQGIAAADITGVAVGTGPAPYTGLRVGLVTAETFAFGVDAQVFGVSSLDALASQGATELQLEAGDQILVVSDARRKEVYFARYEVTGKQRFGIPILNEVVAPQVDTAAQVVAGGHCDGAVVVGPGVRLYAQEFAGQTVSDLTALDVVQPAVIARLALTRQQDGLAQPTSPLYLRRPDAQVPAARKRAKT